MSSAALSSARSGGQAAYPVWQRALLLGAAYFLLAEGGTFLSVRDSTYLSFWLPAGLYVAVLLLNESRAWPWLALAAFSGNFAFDLVHGTHPLAALLFCTANAVQSVGGAWLVRRFVAEQPTLSTLREFLGFICYAAVLSPVASATVGAATLSAFGWSESFATSWRVWWGSNFMAILLLSPLILVWACERSAIRRAIASPKLCLEAALLVGLWIGLTVHLLFWDKGIMAPTKAVIALPALWTTLRFGRFGTAAANVLLAVMFAYFTTQYYAGLTPEQVAAGEYVFVLQIFLAMVACICLVISIAIEERNAKLRALQCSERRYRLLIEDAGFPIVIASFGEDRFLFVNESAGALLGPIDFGKTTVSDFGIWRHPDDRAKFFTELKSNGRVQDREMTIRTPSGGDRWILLSANLIDFGGQQAVFTVFNDITERKRAEQERETLSAILARVTEAVPVCLSYVDAENRYVWTNSRNGERLGIAPEQIIGRTVHEVYAGRYAEVEESAIKVREGITVHKQLEWRLPHGESRIYEYFNVPDLDPDGAFRGCTSLYLDITGLKRTEQELHQSFTRLQEMSRRLVEVEEVERRNISRELHDRVGQNLATLSISLEIIRGTLRDEALRSVAPRLDDGQSLLRATVEHVRNVMAELRPESLDDYGLFAALNIHVTQFSKRFRTEACVSGSNPVPRLPLPVETALFRITQEALANVAKYARATKVDVRLAEQSGCVVLCIADDGLGFDPAEQPVNARSWGMTTMRERAEAVGAALTIASAPGRGTRVEVSISRTAA